MTTIAIVGGGVAGAALFGALLAHETSDTLRWITGGRDIGLGVAYGHAQSHHFLNVRASGMRLYVDENEDFAQYSARHWPGSQPTDFLPRRLFGAYIQAQLRKRMDEAKLRGRCFAVESFTATALRATYNGYEISLDNGERVEADQVVLALGALSPRPLRTVTGDALASGAYVLDPWSLTKRSLAPRRLIVIGTGLTAVDILLSASIQWPHSELIAISRHGQLPSVHSSLPTHPYPHQDAFNARLMACAGPGSILREIRRMLRETPAIDWRSVIDGMRPINARLWQVFTPRQRRQFLRHLRWAWDVSRHRLAPGPAEIIRQLRSEERLHVYAARVLEVDGAASLNVTVRLRANQSVTTLSSDVVVQATGLDTTVTFTEHSLLRGLLEDGLAVADPLDLGVLARPDGHLINAAGCLQRGLYAIGSLVQGNVWECTAMPEIHRAAHALAAQLSTRCSLKTLAAAS